MVAAVFFFIAAEFAAQAGVVAPAAQAAADEPKPTVIQNAGKPMAVGFQCTNDDIQWAGLSCSEEAPCPVYLELTAVESVGNKIFAAGNIHSATSTLYSILLASDDAGKTWREMICFLEGEFKAKPQIAYSVCSGKPGWNVKYKKSGKALCTLYPEKDGFVALVVLGQGDRAAFDLNRREYCSYITGLYDKATLFNGTKWLMINVTDERIFEDVKMLIEMKVKK
jgi:hypothetical protein